jgi:CheY-like chemotaxis protein
MAGSSSPSLLLLFGDETVMLEISPEIVQPSNNVLAYFSAARERKQTSEASGQECPTVLVVDDEETLANTTVEILNISGFCAFVAYDGQTALELAAKLHPDILLTDVVMPEMNGIELAVAIFRVLPQTRILLISGQAGTIDLLEKARQDGHAFELVAKPIHPMKLIEHLRKLGGK